MQWDDLRHVLAVAQAGSYADAARRLGVDQTTVARRLAAAEAALGVRLFERGSVGLRPTAAGEAAVARAARVAMEVGALENGIEHSDAAPAGVVRITAVPLLINRLLVPALPALLEACPRLRIELVAEARNLSLTRREADIALRFARPEGASRSVLARLLGTVGYGVYGRRRSDPGWIGYDEAMGHLPQARWIEQAAGNGGGIRLRAADAETIVAALHAGLGRSLLPCFVGDREAGLVRMASDVSIPLPVREVWMLSHRDLRRHGRIVAVTGWLATILGTPAQRGKA